MTATTPRSYLSIVEFATLIGFSVSTIRRRQDDGLLPKIQPGGKGTKILIPADALEQSTLTLTDDVSNVAGPLAQPALSDASHSEAEFAPPVRRGPRASWRRPI